MNSLRRRRRGRGRSRARHNAASQRPIRLGTKRSRKIFDSALGGESYTLHHNFQPQPVGADYIRLELEEDARKHRQGKSMKPLGGGGYRISYHSNHWLEFWSDAEEDVSPEIRAGYAPAPPPPAPAPAPVAPDPEPTYAPPQLRILPPVTESGRLLASRPAPPPPGWFHLGAPPPPPRPLAPPSPASPPVIGNRVWIADIVGDLPFEERSRAALAKAIRKLLKAKGIKGVSVTAPSYSMASGVKLSGTKRTGGSIGPNREALEELFGIGIRGDSQTIYPSNREDRSDPHTDYSRPQGPALSQGDAAIFAGIVGAAPAPPPPQEALLPQELSVLTPSKRKKLIAALYSSEHNDYRSGGRAHPSVMVPADMGGGMLPLKTASDVDLLELAWARSGRAKVGAVLDWIEGTGPEPKRGRKPAQPSRHPAVTAPAPLPPPSQAELFVPDPERVAAYEERLEGKRERLEERAEKQRAKAAGAFRASDLREEVSGIPFGQPILVGHHSERRHRKAIERAHAATRRGIDAQDYAAHLEGRAERLGTGGISADDPAAVVKLREKLQGLEHSRVLMKEANKVIRRAAKQLGLPTTAWSGLPEGGMARLLDALEGQLDPGILSSIGSRAAAFRTLPVLDLKNTGAEIRRVKDRIAELLKEHQRAPTEDVSHEGFELVENSDINRIQLVFEGKPGPLTRKLLKSNGFRWSPREGAWQRQLNERGRWAAKHVAEKITGEEHGGWLTNPVYGAALRPPGYATVPPGYASVTPHHAFRYGALDYPEALTPEQARSYDLTPFMDANVAADLIAGDMIEYAADYLEDAEEDPQHFVLGIGSALQGLGTYVEGGREVIADLVLERFRAAAAQSNPTLPHEDFRILSDSNKETVWGSQNYSCIIRVRHHFPHRPVLWECADGRHGEANFLPEAVRDIKRRENPADLEEEFWWGS